MFVTEELLTYPLLNKDLLSQLNYARQAMIGSYRELAPEARCDNEFASNIQVNQLNRTLFSLFRSILGNEKERISILQSFLNCDRLLIDKISQLSFADFNRLCCNHYIAFKSSMSIQDVTDALDGNVVVRCSTVCDDEISRFVSAYWIELWRSSKSNFMNTKLRSQLNDEILNKLSLASVDQLNQFLKDKRQLFEFSLDIDHVLASIEAFNDSKEIRMSDVPLLTIQYPNSKTKVGLKGKVVVSAERRKAEDNFFYKPSVFQQLFSFHKIGHGHIARHLINNNVADSNFSLKDVPSVIDLAQHVLREIKSNPKRNKRQIRQKKNLAYHLAALGASRKHIHVFCGLSDAQARTAFENGFAESFFIDDATLPALKSSRDLWQILVSLFAVCYLNLAGRKIISDVVLDALLEAWYNLLEFTTRSNWLLITPYVANLSLFLDWALWLREGKLTFHHCTICDVMYVRQESLKSDERELREESLKLKNRKNRLFFDLHYDCPFCKLREGMQAN